MPKRKLTTIATIPWQGSAPPPRKSSRKKVSGPVDQTNVVPFVLPASKASAFSRIHLMSNMTCPLARGARRAGFIGPLRRFEKGAGAQAEKSVSSSRSSSSFSASSSLARRFRSTMRTEMMEIS